MEADARRQLRPPLDIGLHQGRRTGECCGLATELTWPILRTRDGPLLAEHRQSVDRLNPTQSGVKAETLALGRF